jgi:hypothetical protein
LAASHERDLQREIGLDPLIDHASSADPARERSRMTVVLGDGLRPEDVIDLIVRVRGLCEAGDVELVVCDLGMVVHPDAGTVDALARLQLMTRRLCRRVAFENAAPRLQELLDLMGLADILPQPEPQASADASAGQGTMPSSSSDSSSSSGSR